MPDTGDLYRSHNDRMEDFWNRRANQPHHERTIHVFGRPVLFSSNQASILDSAALAERMYSSAPGTGAPPWRVRITVHDPDPAPGPPPERLMDRIHYSGTEEWLSIGLGAWGSCLVDLKGAQAYAVLPSSMAAQPELVCRVLLNTVLNNFATRHGFSMLHASALSHGGRLLILMAPHGTGKSTTALRLITRGYQLISDSQVYLEDREGMLWLGGFPAGRIKLRADMLPHFPRLAEAARPEPVRNETKHRVDLDAVDPAMVQRDMLPVSAIDFCLLDRRDRVESQLEPLTVADLWPEVMVNSLHYDTRELWQENLDRIGRLLELARLHRLHIGTSGQGIYNAVAGLWT